MISFFANGLFLTLVEVAIRSYHESGDELLQSFYTGGVLNSLGDSGSNF